ncbi:MAG: FGGY family carbohydrate kinase, partial [Rhizobacter sp.]
NGWVEHDAEEIWQTTLACCRAAAKGVEPKDIAAIGITNQRETTVLWNRKTGEPVHHAIVWQDRRAEPLCARLRDEGMADTIREKTGLVIDAYFSGTKLRWLLDNVPGARAAAGRGELAFGTVDSWLIWQLTRGKVHATDVSNASRTMLFNVRTNQWDADLLKALDIPESLMPQVKPSSAHFADTDERFLDASLFIGGVAGDQQSALFGQACFDAGMAKNTYGTGCFALMNTGDRLVRSRNRLVTTVAWRRSQTLYALEGSVFMGGAIVQWLRDGLGII